MDSEKQERYEKYKKRRRRATGLAVALLLVVPMVVLSIASLIKPDVKFSAEENRILTQRPKLNPETLKSKSFMEDMESYTSDQFIFRDWWVSLKVRSDMLLGKREFNGVYLGKEKYLMQAMSEPNEKAVKENLAAISNLADKNSSLNVNVMIIPNAAYVLKDKLPKGAPVRDQSEDMKQIREELSGTVNCIDVTRTLKKHQDEQIYYKTDHHWTSKGACLAFEDAAESLGITDPVTNYDIYTVTMDFSGTLASRSGYHSGKDSIQVYAPKDGKTEYLVTDSDNKEQRATVYDRDALKEKDKYQVFFGGNHALVDITTANDTKNRLLVFKDSYANCFVPFLIPYYNEIVMVDPRYYYDNVDQLISSKGITDVLFLYNMDTFLTDNSISDVLASDSSDSSEE